MSTFRAIYEIGFLALLRLVEEDSKLKEVNIMIKQRNLILDKLKENLMKAQERIKSVVDRRRKRNGLPAGEHVFLQIQSYCFRCLASWPNKKLSPCFYKPYEILERVGQVVNKLKLSSSTKILLIFHFS